MFGYLRIFSLLSLITVVILTVTVGIFFRTVLTDDLTRMVEKNSSSLAQGYVNTVWKEYRDVIVPIADNPAQLQGNPQVGAFAADTVKYFQNLPLVRINIYSANGLLLFSNDVSANKIAGGGPSPDSGFITGQIKSANIASQVVKVPLQNTPNARLVQTFFPIRVGGGSDAVMGIFADVTDSWDRLSQMQWVGIGGIILLFLIFLMMLSFSSRKAETIIAKQYETNVELSEAAAAAEEASREKSQFLANISHELRTPLNAIIGFSNIIKAELMPTLTERKYDDYINDINTSGVHLLSLINDILDYSKAEAGKLELEISEVNVTKVIQSSLRLVSPRAEAAQVRLVEQLPADALVMTVDGKKFKQIFLNLLSNSVKFTPPAGEIRVTAWHNVTDDTLSFEVEDTGIGIAPKDISRAMSPFGQVDNGLKRKYEGTGLGLPLTKKFVELMGGKFTIESEVNKGTKITFTLPREIKPMDGVVIKQAS